MHFFTIKTILKWSYLKKAGVPTILDARGGDDQGESTFTVLIHRLTFIGATPFHRKERSYVEPNKGRTIYRNANIGSTKYRKNEYIGSTKFRKNKCKKRKDGKNKYRKNQIKEHQNKNGKTKFWNNLTFSISQSWFKILTKCTFCPKTHIFMKTAHFEKKRTS